MFKVSVLDIAKTAIMFEDLATCVILPGEDGELSLMDFHQNLVATLKEGVVRIDAHKPIEVKKGIVKVDKNGVSILIER